MKCNVCLLMLNCLLIDPGCKCESCFPADQTSGAPHGEKRVRMWGNGA